LRVSVKASRGGPLPAACAADGIALTIARVAAVEASVPGCVRMSSAS
jgi:hypothetical protein